MRHGNVGTATSRPVVLSVSQRRLARMTLSSVGEVDPPALAPYIIRPARRLMTIDHDCQSSARERDTVSASSRRPPPGPSIRRCYAPVRLTMAAGEPEAG